MEISPINGFSPVSEFENFKLTVLLAREYVKILVGLCVARQVGGSLTTPIITVLKPLKLRSPTRGGMRQYITTVPHYDFFPMKYFLVAFGPVTGGQTDRQKSIVHTHESSIREKLIIPEK